MNIKRLICFIVSLLLLCVLCIFLIVNNVQKQTTTKQQQFLKAPAGNPYYRANIKSITEAINNQPSEANNQTGINTMLQADRATTSTSKLSTEKQNVTVENIIKELGKNEEQIIKESIYNETENVKMCWNNILYVNESNKNISGLWHEFRVTLDFPSIDDSANEGDSKVYKKYVIQIDGRNQEQSFEVVTTNPNYIISKLENKTCQIGTYLSKVYYEWPQSGNKKIVLRLTDQHQGLEFNREHFINVQMKENRAEQILGSRFVKEKPFSGQPFSLLEPKSKNNNDSDDLEIDDKFEDDSMEYEDLNKIVNVPKAQNKKAKSSKVAEETGFHKNFKDQINQTNLEFVTSKPHEATAVSLNNTEVLPSVKPCSSVLSQLLLGKGILSELCSFKKDDTLVLQGDITVSKKYYNKVDNEKVVRPLFVIHEKTEIESKENYQEF